MKRSVTAVVLAAFLAAGCGIFGDKDAPKKDWGAKEYYDAAKQTMNDGQWSNAIKLYEQLESKFPFGRYAQQAALETAYCYYKENDTAQAVSTVDRFLKSHPNHANVDYALYLKGLANFKEDLGPLGGLARQDLADRDPKAARESFEIFKDLVTRFPEGRYSNDARRRMDYLVDALARHEVHVAQYYLRRGAYLAAVNRSQDVLIRYPNTIARREALDVMVEAYDRMGLAQLRDDTKKVLVRNFPTDPMGKSGSNSSSWFSWLPWYK
jgi:outer membrane protein assembly factor BamD